MKPERSKSYATVGTGLIIVTIAVVTGCATSSPNVGTSQPAVTKTILDDLTAEEQQQTGRMAVLVVFSDYDTHVSGAFRADRGNKDSNVVADVAGETAGAGMGGLLLASLTVTAPYAATPLVVAAGAGAGAGAVAHDAQYDAGYSPRDRVKILKKQAYNVLENCSAHHQLLRTFYTTPDLHLESGTELLAQVPGVDPEAKMLVQKAINQHDSYLEVSLEQIKVHYGRHRDESPWRNTVDVHIRIRARMIRVRDGAILSDNVYEARNMVNRTTRLKALLANRAALLNQKILLGLQQNTAAIADDFLKQRPSATSSPEHLLTAKNRRY